MEEPARRRITLRELRAAVLDAVDESPYSRNPMRDTALGRYCVYTDPEDQRKHCLLGAAIKRLGIQPPHSDVVAPISRLVYSGEMWKDLKGQDIILNWDDDALDYAIDCQRASDNYQVGGAEPVKWYLLRHRLSNLGGLGA